jgi:hypothetical protein
MRRVAAEDPSHARAESHSAFGAEPQREDDLPVPELVRQLSDTVVLAAVLDGTSSSQLSPIMAPGQRWLDDYRTSLKGCPPIELGAVVLRTWARSVVAECEAAEAVAAMGDGLDSDAACGRLIRLLPLEAHIRALRRAKVPRDLVAAKRAAAFQNAADAIGSARLKYEAAQATYPTYRVKKSADNIDLDREIHDLRDEGSWIPWDHETSDGAIKRVRRHFRSGYEQRHRYELANDLVLVRALVSAKAGLAREERRHAAALGPLYRVDGPWVAGTLAGHLTSLLRVATEQGITAGDLDAAWALGRPLAVGRSLWDSIRDLEVARTRRAATTAEQVMPRLSNYSARLLRPLPARQRTSWREFVAGDAAILDSVLRHSRKFDEVRNALLDDGARKPVEDAAERIQEAFLQSRRNQFRHVDLAGAMSAAVDASVGAFAVLERELRGVLYQARPGDRDAQEAWDLEVSYLEGALQRRAEALSSFRVVLFGRTGTGKSSFIEALTGGDGKSISTGECDFTTYSRAVKWGACTLIDTPGIEGWGRDVTTVELESETRRSLDTADLVLLAFDTSNQKIGEFEKVARWVLEFDKPTVALLNVRNSHWRRPDKEPDLEVRRGYSQNVHENAQHIGDALAAFGLLASIHRWRWSSEWVVTRECPYVLGELDLSKDPIRPAGRASRRCNFLTLARSSQQCSTTRISCRPPGWSRCWSWRGPPVLPSWPISI